MFLQIPDSMPKYGNLKNQPISQKLRPVHTMMEEQKWAQFQPPGVERVCATSRTTSVVPSLYYAKKVHADLEFACKFCFLVDSVLLLSALAGTKGWVWLHGLRGCGCGYSKNRGVGELDSHFHALPCLSLYMTSGCTVSGPISRMEIIWHICLNFRQSRKAALLLPIHVTLRSKACLACLHLCVYWCTPPTPITTHPPIKPSRPLRPITIPNVKVNRDRYFIYRKSITPLKNFFFIF